MINRSRERLNVLAVFASFRQKGIERRIVPRQFVRSNGELHTVRKVCRTYTISNNHASIYHFIVITSENQGFNIAYHKQKMHWFLAFEYEDQQSLMAALDDK